jgi:hypothetical protein
MAKTYEVKVYDSENNYLTTWKDVVSNIQFNNEINTAGGQLKFTFRVLYLHIIQYTRTKM